MRRTIAFTGLLTGICACALLIHAQSRDDQKTAAQSRRNDELRAIQGIAIAPVPLNLDGKDPILVGVGSYIVNSGGCGDCHTYPNYANGGNPFMGQPLKINTAQYMTGGRQFGPFTSRNLTPSPSENNEPAGLSLDEFMVSMRTGVDHDQKHVQVSPLLQVMPWPEVGKMTDYDLKAIYTYLTAIPALPDNPNPAP